MKWMMALFLALGICTTDAADDVDAVIRQLREEIVDERSKLTTMRRKLADKRHTLHTFLVDADAKRRTLTVELNALDKTSQRVMAEIETTARERAAAEETIDRCSNLLRETRKDLQTPFSRAAPSLPLFETIDTILQSESPMAKTVFDELFDAYQGHVSRCTTITRAVTSIILPNGDTVESEVLSVGGFAAFSVSPNRLGILESAPTENGFRLTPIASSKAIQAALTNASQPRTALRLPLDVSGGRGIKRLAQAKSLFSFLKAGGPVVIPLLILGVLAGIMIIERTIFLLRVDKNVDRMLTAVIPSLEKADFDGAMAHVEGKRGPVANVVRGAVQHGRRNVDRLEELLQEGILAELPALERFLGALAVMAAAAPLLGLLGTVSGMIGTFEVISSYGTGNAKMLSGGISEALITTKVGLIIAVPILLAHAFLNRQVRVIVGHMDRAALSLAGAIRYVREKEDGS